MTILRVEKTKNYTVMSNEHLKHKDMSLKAKGLLSVMLSLPDNWDYSVAGLVTICKESETAIKSTLKELQEFGYVYINKIYPNKSTSGRIEYEYIIYEQAHKKQDLDFQGVEIQGVENITQLNTNKLNTNKVNKPSKEGSQPLINTQSKKEQKSKDISTMYSMINAFTQNEDIQKRLKDYFQIRVKKGLTPKQWEIILADLRKYAGTDGDLAIEKIEGAIAGGYMQIIANWEKDKANLVKRKAFDNTSAHDNLAVVKMNTQQKEQFDKDLAKDQNGSYLQF